MGVFNFSVDGVWLSPNFQRPLATKLCIRPQKFSRYNNVHARGPLSPCHVWCGSDFTRRRTAKNVEFFCLSVCPFVRHAFEPQSLCVRFRHEGVGLQKRFRYVGWGKVCSCAPVFNLLRLLPIDDTTKCRNPKYRKN